MFSNTLGIIFRSSSKKQNKNLFLGFLNFFKNQYNSWKNQLFWGSLTRFKLIFLEPRLRAKIGSLIFEKCGFKVITDSLIFWELAVKAIHIKPRPYLPILSSKTLASITFITHLCQKLFKKLMRNSYPNQKPTRAVVRSLYLEHQITHFNNVSIQKPLLMLSLPFNVTQH